MAALVPVTINVNYDDDKGKENRKKTPDLNK